VRKGNNSDVQKCRQLERTAWLLRLDSAADAVDHVLVHLVLKLSHQPAVVCVVLIKLLCCDKVLKVDLATEEDLFPCNRVGEGHEGHPQGQRRCDGARKNLGVRRSLADNAEDVCGRHADDPVVVCRLLSNRLEFDNRSPHESTLRDKHANHLPRHGQM
jgi:hypothetical protein